MLLFLNNSMLAIIDINIDIDMFNISINIIIYDKDTVIKILKIDNNKKIFNFFVFLEE